MAGRLSWKITVLILVGSFLLAHCEMGEDLLIKRSELREECLKPRATESPKPDELYCERMFDNVLCWPDTPANTTVRHPCPIELLQYVANNTYATRRCETDGTWYKNEHNKSWTNYTMCRPEDEEYGTQWKIHRSLQIVYSIGYALSLISLIIAMGIFLYFRKLRCTRNMIHMHLFMSFILRAIFVFIRDIIQAQTEADMLRYEILVEEVGDLDNATMRGDNGNPGCKVAFTLIQYFLVANFYWLLVEGVYLHSLITLAVFTEKSIYRYIALGWGVPAFVVVPWAIVRSTRESQGCWWNDVTRDNSYWIIKAPVMISVVLNFVLFLHILCVLATKLRASNAAEARRYSKFAKATLILIPLFGCYYVITVGLHAFNNPTMVYIRMYFELILSPFQGFLLAILYCFLNGEVKNEINRKWRLHLLNSTLSSHRCASLRNGHSRSSCSTPPRKDSMRNHSVLEPRGGGRSKIGERFYALRKQFTRSDPSNGHAGSVPLGNSIASPDPGEPRPTPDGTDDRNNLYELSPTGRHDYDNFEEANETTKIDIKVEEPSDATPQPEDDVRMLVPDGIEEKSDIFEDDDEHDGDGGGIGNGDCHDDVNDDCDLSGNDTRQTFTKNIETEV